MSNTVPFPSGGLELEIPSTITGTIRDTNGDPITGGIWTINVCSHPFTYSPMAGLDEYIGATFWDGVYAICTVLIREDGTFEISDLADGDYVLRLLDGSGTYADTWQGAEGATAATANVITFEGTTVTDADFIVASDSPAFDVQIWDIVSGIDYLDLAIYEKMGEDKFGFMTGKAIYDLTEGVIATSNPLLENAEYLVVVTGVDSEETPVSIIFWNNAPYYVLSSLANPVDDPLLIFGTPPLPTITDITPDSVYVGDGIIITGHDFGETQEASTVTIGGEEGIILSWSDTRIVVVLSDETPLGSAIPVVLTVDGGSITETIEVKYGTILRLVTMNHSLTGGDYSGVLLDINNGDDYCYVDIKYPVPSPTIEWRDPAHSDGRDVSFSTYPNREITLTLQVYGDNKEALSTNVRALIEWLDTEGSILEWRPIGWADSLYFDLIAPPIEFNTPDWFETWIRDNNQMVVFSNVEILLEAKPFARGAEETVTLLDGDGSPMIQACTGIVVPPEFFKGDVPAPADIHIDLVGGTLWNNLIFGQRLKYSADFDPIREPVGEATVLRDGRLNGNYETYTAPESLYADMNYSFEAYSDGSPDTWTDFTVTENGDMTYESTTEQKSAGSRSFKTDYISEGNYGVNTSITIDPVAIDPTHEYMFLFDHAVAGSPYTILGVSIDCFDDLGHSTGMIGIAAGDGVLYGVRQYLPLSWETAYVPVPYMGYSFPADTTKISMRVDIYPSADEYPPVEGTTYIDNWRLLDMSLVSPAYIDYLLAGYEGDYLPVISASFNETGGAEINNDLTFTATLVDGAGTAYSEDELVLTAALGTPTNSKFREMAFMSNRFPPIAIPTRGISEFSDKELIHQRITIRPETAATSPFMYDYMGIMPVDRGYIEVQNWGDGDHIILDSRGTGRPLISKAGGIDEAVPLSSGVKGACTFVADPKGFNGAILAVNKSGFDYRIDSYLDVKMVYSPYYLIVPER